MTQPVTHATHIAPGPPKVSLKSAPTTFGLIANDHQTAAAEIAQAAALPRAVAGSTRLGWVQRQGKENRLPVELIVDALRTEAACVERDTCPTHESRQLGPVSLAVAVMCDTDVESSVKARMLRELAAWYRTLASRAGNPVIWECRLLTAADLDAEASRIEQRQVG
jgi:hypothetical protein